MRIIKKLFLIFVLMIVAFQFGASELPHAHGSDWNHTTHPDCPLYQLSVHLVSDHFPVFSFIFILLLYAALVRGPLFTTFVTYRWLYQMRAPPVMFSLIHFRNEKSSQLRGAQNETLNTNNRFILCGHLLGYVPI